MTNKYESILGKIKSPCEDPILEESEDELVSDQTQISKNQPAPEDKLAEQKISLIKQLVLNLPERNSTYKKPEIIEKKIITTSAEAKKDLDLKENQRKEILKNIKILKKRSKESVIKKNESEDVLFSIVINKKINPLISKEKAEEATKEALADRKEILDSLKKTIKDLEETTEAIKAAEKKYLTLLNQESKSKAKKEPHESLVGKIWNFFKSLFSEITTILLMPIAITPTIVPVPIPAMTIPPSNAFNTPKTGLATVLTEKPKQTKKLRPSKAEKAKSKKRNFVRFSKKIDASFEDNFLTPKPVFQASSLP